VTITAIPPPIHGPNVGISSDKPARIANTGAKLVFVDIKSDTFNIDASKIEAAITDKTKAVMPVHLYGQMADMEAINEIAKRNKLFVIEDAAQAIGASQNRKMAGSVGDIGCFSFFPTKNMTTGEGGMVTTDDEEIANKVKAIRGHGISTSTHDREEFKEPWARSSVMAGYNFRMNDIAGAIGLVQLSKLDDMNRKRRKHAAFLTEELSKIDGINPPFEMQGAMRTYQMYVIQTDEKIDRDRFVHYLRDNGIEANVHFFPPVHMQDYYMKTYGCKEGDFPITEKVARRVVTLPMFPSLTQDQLQKIVDIVGEASKKCLR